jgi:hypothetical protein
MNVHVREADACMFSPIAEHCPADLITFSYSLTSAQQAKLLQARPRVPSAKCATWTLTMLLGPVDCRCCCSRPLRPVFAACHNNIWSCCLCTVWSDKTRAEVSVTAPDGTTANMRLTSLTDVSSVSVVLLCSDPALPLDGTTANMRLTSLTDR